MKKTVVLFIVAALVVVTCGFWFFSSPKPLHSIDWLTFGILALLVVFAVYIGYRRLNSTKKGEIPEDELSKKIMQKSAALSYYISLYLWLVFIYVSDKVKLETDELIGAGILGMAIVFAISWMVFTFRGIKHE
jgi:peptidoglycan/LPS O-acetylase OafA/YrhL